MRHIVLLSLSIVFLFTVPLALATSKNQIVDSAYERIFKRSQTTTPVKVTGDEPLYIRISKSYLNTNQDGGDSYTLYVIDNKKTRHGFDGNLEVQGKVCPINNNQISASCKEIKPTAWPDSVSRVEKGKIKVTLPKSSTQQYIRAQFRPRGTNKPWSNFVTSNMNSTAGLYDMSKYWNIPSNPSGISDNYPALFKGTNFTYNPAIPFRTYFGFAPERDVCGEKAKPMYITKDRPEGYWAPKLAQYNEQPLFQKRIFWYVMNFDNKFKNTLWEDNYLWALTDDHSLESSGNPWNFLDVSRERILGPGQLNNTMGAYRSWDPKLPPYILAPRFLGEGWGIEGDHAYQAIQPGETNCTIAASDPAQHTLWIIEIDPVQIHPSLSNPKAAIPTLRISFHEGNHSFSDPNANGPFPKPGNYMLREDWYFQENVGLVKINTNSWGYQPWYEFRASDNNHLCNTDDDCFVNQEIQHPNVSLTRFSLMDRVTGDIDEDGAVDTQDATLFFEKYNNGSALTILSEDSASDKNPVTPDINQDGKINSWDYVELLSNFGK